MNYGGLILVVLSGLVLFFAIMDFDWYMNNPRTKIFVNKFGRQNARIFHIVLSSIMFIVGIFITLYT
ncbi:MAG: immunity 17 family protein [Candidatus Hodarchaeales archaeon]|jgi:hypothetical protein